MEFIVGAAFFFVFALGSLLTFKLMTFNDAHELEWATSRINELESVVEIMLEHGQPMKQQTIVDWRLWYDCVHKRGYGEWPAAQLPYDDVRREYLRDKKE